MGIILIYLRFAAACFGLVFVVPSATAQTGDTTFFGGCKMEIGRFDLAGNTLPVPEENTVYFAAVDVWPFVDSPGPLDMTGTYPITRYEKAFTDYLKGRTNRHPSDFYCHGLHKSRDAAQARRKESMAHNGKNYKGQDQKVIDTEWTFFLGKTAGSEQPSPKALAVVTRPAPNIPLRVEAPVRDLAAEKAEKDRADRAQAHRDELQRIADAKNAANAVEQAKRAGEFRRARQKLLAEVKSRRAACKAGDKTKCGARGTRQ